MSDKSLKIEELLKNIDAKISHIEDMEADNRSVIIKLVKQSNQIVEFLKQLELHEVDEEGFLLKEEFKLPPISESKKLKEVKELLDEYLTKQKDLKELEDELKKHKGDITPGQIGEA